MELTRTKTPRTFKAGVDSVSIKDCAHIQLDPDEQVSFITESGTQYDVARKEFGYYATPSLNGRLCEHGLHAVLTKNTSGRFYIMLVERNLKETFENYLSTQDMTIVCWLDNDEALLHLEQAMSNFKNRLVST